MDRILEAAQQRANVDAQNRNLSATDQVNRVAQSRGELNASAKDVLKGGKATREIQTTRDLKETTGKIKPKEREVIVDVLSDLIDTAQDIKQSQREGEVDPFVTIVGEVGPHLVDKLKKGDQPLTRNEFIIVNAVLAMAENDIAMGSGHEAWMGNAGRGAYAPAGLDILNEAGWWVRNVIPRWGRARVGTANQRNVGRSDQTETETNARLRARRYDRSTRHSVREIARTRQELLILSDEKGTRSKVVRTALSAARPRDFIYTTPNKVHNAIWDEIPDAMRTMSQRGGLPAALPAGATEQQIRNMFQGLAEGNNPVAYVVLRDAMSKAISRAAIVEIDAIYAAKATEVQRTKPGNINQRITRLNEANKKKTDAEVDEELKKTKEWREHEAAVGKRDIIKKLLDPTTDDNTSAFQKYSNWQARDGQITSRLGEIGGNITAYEGAITTAEGAKNPAATTPAEKSLNATQDTIIARNRELITQAQAEREQLTSEQKRLKQDYDRAVQQLVTATAMPQADVEAMIQGRGANPADVVRIAEENVFIPEDPGPPVAPASGTQARLEARRKIISGELTDAEKEQVKALEQWQHVQSNITTAMASYIDNRGRDNIFSARQLFDTARTQAVTLKDHKDVGQGDRNVTERVYAGERIRQLVLMSANDRATIDPVLAREMLPDGVIAERIIDMFPGAFTQATINLYDQARAVYDNDGRPGNEAQLEIERKLLTAVINESGIASNESYIASLLLRISRDGVIAAGTEGRNPLLAMRPLKEIRERRTQAQIDNLVGNSGDVIVSGKLSPLRPVQPGQTIGDRVITLTAAGEGYEARWQFLTDPYIARDTNRGPYAPETVFTVNGVEQADTPPQAYIALGDRLLAMAPRDRLILLGQTQFAVDRGALNSPLLTGLEGVYYSGGNLLVRVNGETHTLVHYYQQLADQGGNPDAIRLAVEQVQQQVGRSMIQNITDQQARFAQLRDENSRLQIVRGPVLAAQRTLQQQHTVERQRVAALPIRLAAIPDEITNAEERLEVLNEQIRRLPQRDQTEVERLAGERTTAEATRDNTRSQRNTVRSQFNAANRRRGANRNEAEITRLRGELDTAEQTFQAAERRLRELQQQYREADRRGTSNREIRERTRLENQQRTIQREIAQLQNEQQTVTEQIETANATRIEDRIQYRTLIARVPEPLREIVRSRINTILGLGATAQEYLSASELQMILDTIDQTQAEYVTAFNNRERAQEQSRLTVAPAGEPENLGNVNRHRGEAVGRTMRDIQQRGVRGAQGGRTAGNRAWEDQRRARVSRTPTRPLP